MLNITILASILLSFIQEPSFKKDTTPEKNVKTVNPEFSNLLEKIYPDDIPTLSIMEFKTLKKEKFYLLDTRGKEEFSVSHLKHAREVGYLWFDMRDVYDIPKDAIVIMYCAIGNRSSRIAERLMKAGYKNVYVLYGGIFEWVNEGNPVYTQKDIQTSQIHGYTKEWSIWLEKGSKVF
jgi:rhodanese-related sulfurtransferase